MTPNVCNFYFDARKVWLLLRRTGLIFAAFISAWVLSACAGDPTCGYVAASLYPDSVKTIAVPILTSKAFTRNVEFELTDALIKEIESRTPYKVTSQERADTILLGQVRDVKLDQLSKSRLTGLSEEVIVSVTIDFEWKDLRSGKTILRREKFAGHGLFVPSRPSGEPIELGRFAAVQQLARDIVAELRAQW
jgi:hypothetical protein